jgi:hypothetical protein
MSVLRNTALLVLVACVAVLAVGVLPSSAQAGGCHGYGYSSYYPSWNHASYSNYDCYHGHCYWPATYHTVKPISYPVTYYDCYGLPYVVWQTSYSYAP